jgi:hypothetical protein
VIQPPPPRAPFSSSLPPPETSHRLNPSGGQGRRRQGIILHHQIRSRSPPVRRRRRGRALHGGRGREKKGDANWKTVAKSGPDPRRCSASVGGPAAPEAATARGGLHRPGGSACGLLCITHRLRADLCRGSRRRRRDLRLGQTSAGTVGGGGGICVSGKGGSLASGSFGAVAACRQLLTVLIPPLPKAHAPSMAPSWSPVAHRGHHRRRAGVSCLSAGGHSLLPDLLEVIRVLVVVFVLAFCRIDGSTSTSGYGCRRSSSHTLSVQGTGMT